MDENFEYINKIFIPEEDIGGWTKTLHAGGFSEKEIKDIVLPNVENVQDKLKKLIELDFMIKNTENFTAFTTKTSALVKNTPKYKSRQRKVDDMKREIEIYTTEREKIIAELKDFTDQFKREI